MTTNYGFLFSNPLKAAMPSIDFRQLRANVSMAEVLELLRFVIIERTGDQVRGECPLHEPSASEKHRSFSAHFGRNIFRCFKCGASGNQLDLWAKASKKPLFEAALDLCTRLNKEAPRLAPEIEKRNS
jgi:DNA primase